MIRLSLSSAYGISFEEYSILVKTMEENENAARNQVILNLMYGYGLKLKECLNLSLQNIQKFRNDFGQTAAILSLSHPKTGDTETITLHPATVHLLERYIEEAATKYLQLSNISSDSYRYLSCPA